MIVALQHRHPLQLIVSGAALLGLACLLIVAHVRQTQAMEQDVLPRATQVSNLEHRRDLLRQQVDLSALSSAERAGSFHERIQMHVLPPIVSTDRFLALFAAVSDTLQKRDWEVHASAVSFGDAAPMANDLLQQPVTFSVIVAPEGLDAWLSFIDLLGYVTVADAFSADDIRLLTTTAEKESPMSIDALQKFLSMDLSTYATDPVGYRDRLLGSVSGGTFAAALQGALATPLLEEAGRFFNTDVGRAILDQKLWPMPYATLDTMSVEPTGEGMNRVKFVLKRVGRGENGELKMEN